MWLKFAKKRQEGQARRLTGRGWAKPDGEIHRHVEYEVLEMKVRIIWIPAHEGVAGNEAADQAAKEATGWRRLGSAPDGQGGKTGRTSRRGDRENTGRGGHGEDCTFPQATESGSQGKTKLTTSPRMEISLGPGKARENLCTKSHPNPQERYWNSKATSSVLVQMRTEKIGLRLFLYQRKVPGIENGLCNCRRGLQTVKHILLDCAQFTHLRTMTLHRGEGSQGNTTDLRTILSTPALALKAAKFMIQMKLLGQFGAISQSED